MSCQVLVEQPRVQTILLRAPDVADPRSHHSPRVSDQVDDMGVKGPNSSQFKKEPGWCMKHLIDLMYLLSGRELLRNTSANSRLQEGAYFPWFKATMFPPHPSGLKELSIHLFTSSS